MAIEAAFFGSLGSDAEAKVTKSGKDYLRLNVRVDDGTEVLWVSVMAFDPHALEQAAKFAKGARVYIEGRLRPTEYTGRDGTARHGLSAVSWHCRLAQIGRNKPTRRERKGDVETSQPVNSAPPFNDQIGF